MTTLYSPGRIYRVCYGKNCFTTVSATAGLATVKVHETVATKPRVGLLVGHMLR